MKFSLDLGVRQHLTLSPQLQQAIALLQLSSTELQQEVQHYVESNPLLEIPEEKQFQTATTFAAKQTNTDQLESIENRLEVIESLRDHLVWQLSLAHFNETELLIATAIIDSIDDDGFLTVALEIIQETLEDVVAVSISDIESVLKMIQQFEPVGVGARNFRENLLIQLDQLENQNIQVEIARRIIQNDLVLLAKHENTKLKKRYNLSDESLFDVIKLIKSLHPRPVSRYEDQLTRYIVPDIVVNKVNNRWEIALNNEIDYKLKINQQYAAMIRRGDKSDENQYIRDHLREAQWLIKSINARNETILRVSKFLVEKQDAFLRHGPIAMKPLVIREVSKALGLHDSTISRATSGKYILTPQGIFELKYFFSTQLSSESQGGHSAVAIKELIKQYIQEENPTNPVTDSQITAFLKHHGIQVARRTVAKYREKLGIESSSVRKLQDS